MISENLSNEIDLHIVMSEKRITAIWRLLPPMYCPIAKTTWFNEAMTTSL